MTKPTEEVAPHLSSADEKSSQPPLKRLRLLAQDMTNRSSATAIAASNTVDSELISYFADSKARPMHAQNDGLHFWIVNELKYPL